MDMTCMDMGLKVSCMEQGRMHGHELTVGCMEEAPS